MYEKRRYGSKIRYRVTDSMTNSMAKRVAKDLREAGVGAQLDTYRGGFAVWADTKLSSINFSYYKINNLEEHRKESWSKRTKKARIYEGKTKKKRKRYPSGIYPPDTVGTKQFEKSMYEQQGRKHLPPEVVIHENKSYFLLSGGFGHGNPALDAAKFLKKDGATEVYICRDKRGSTIARIYFTPNVRAVDWEESYKITKGGRLKKVYSGPPRSKPQSEPVIVRGAFSKAEKAFKKHSEKVRSPREIGKAKRALAAPIEVLPSSEFPITLNVIMENREGTSKKFWGWRLWPPTKRTYSYPVDIFWGRIDAKTFRKQTRLFQTEAEMEDFISKKFKEKQAKGYKVTYTQGSGSFKY